MDIALEDLIETWATHHYPELLYEPETLSRLILFVHQIILAAVQTERAAVLARLLKVHPC